MEQFYYTAVAPDGKKVSGLVEAKDQAQAVQILREKQLLVTSIKDARSGFSYQLKMKMSGVGEKDVIAFTRQLSSMILAGLPITKSLHLLQKQSRPGMAKIVEEIARDVESGSSLYESLKKHPQTFSNVYLSLVRAGEMAGVLGQVLERLAKNLERNREFKMKVKSAMLYPAIVIIAMLGVGGIMIFFVMPQISQVYEEFEAELPFLTQVVLGVTAAIRNLWALWILIIIIGIVALVYFLRSKEGRTKFDSFILKVPLIGDLQKKVISANVFRTLSMLHHSGVSIVESLQVVAYAANNLIYEREVIEASKNVEKGVALGSSFVNEKIFPEIVVQMITIGEETGKLSDMLDRVSEQFEKESILALKSLTNAIEPTLIIFLGVGVGLMVVSVIMPIYSLTSQF